MEERDGDEEGEERESEFGEARRGHGESCSVWRESPHIGGERRNLVGRERERISCDGGDVFLDFGLTKVFGLGTWRVISASHMGGVGSTYMSWAYII